MGSWMGIWAPAVFSKKTGARWITFSPRFCQLRALSARLGPPTSVSRPIQHMGDREDTVHARAVAAICIHVRDPKRGHPRQMGHEVSKNWMPREPRPGLSTWRGPFLISEQEHSRNVVNRSQRFVHTPHRNAAMCDDRVENAVPKGSSRVLSAANGQEWKRKPGPSSLRLQTTSKLHTPFAHAVSAQ